MKQLRILSGKHAGATLDLSPGNHSLGKNDDTQITITDWTFDALNMHVGNDGKVSAQWAASGASGLPLADYIPVDFSGVVVCIGPQGGNWPSDEKLAAATQKASADGKVATTEKRRGPLVPAIAGVMVALVAGGWLFAALSKPKEVPPPTIEMVRASLQTSFDKTLSGRLVVTAERGSLLVDGMVDTPEQAREVSTILADQAPRYPLVQKVSIATDVAESIRSSVGLPNAEVSYKGNGAFSYAVKASDIAAAQASIDRVRTDLSPVVKRIDAVLEESLGRPAIPRLLSSWSAGSVSVMETRDGVKHLVITDAPSDVPVLGEVEAASPTSPPISGAQAAN
jgi:type III secretion protein D